MGKIIEKKVELQRHFDKEAILTMVECYKDNPAYESYSQTFDNLVQQYVNQIIPKGYFIIDEEAGRVECLVTLGAQCDQWIQEAFATYMYLEGMMLNSLFDMMLYEASGELYEHIKAMLSDEQFLSVRYEPGQTHVPIEEQGRIFQNIQQKYSLDMYITDGYMISPTKSTVYFYKIDDSNCSLGIDHDCSHCELGCVNKKFNLTLDYGNTKKMIQGKIGENLLEVLRRNRIFVDAPCGGKKVCGKCKIQIKGHTFNLADEEKQFLGQELIDDGYVLACYHELDSELTLNLTQELNVEEQEKKHIESNYEAFKITESNYDLNAKTQHYGIAVDIGTTTLVVSLVDLVSQEVMGTKKTLNPQKAYGADVINRIQYASENKGHALGKVIRDTIWSLTVDLCQKVSVDIEKMVVSGNTTMMYLLLDMPPEKLAVAPFETEEPPIVPLDGKAIFEESLYSFQLIVIPWVSAYVGGDIVSGIYMNRFDEQPGNNILIDIGTNGEMVIRTDKGMISAATAAGPAFEGANIQCGMGSIEGAICEIHYENQGYEIITLGNQKAKGINGSALVDGVALLLKQGKVDSMGYMENPEMIVDAIGLYPEDIRQVQLAKGAIHAGVEVLVEEAGISMDDIDGIYIAGGFGSHMNIHHAAVIGLIPKSLEDKVKIIGNASLGGAIRCLLEKNGEKRINGIREKCDYIELSSNMKFNTAYMNSMIFEME